MAIQSTALSAFMTGKDRMALFEKDSFNHHISQQFNADLEGLRKQFLMMGGLVEQQLGDAVHALLDTNAALAQQVQAVDHRVNQMETHLDQTLMQVLARRQPTASDLRMVLAVSKANTDLERIGDEASKIARIAQALAEEGESPRGYTETRHIGNQVRLILRDALDAFARMDTEQALTVLQADSDIDREYQSATRALMTYMMEDPRYMSRIMNVLWVLRSLERMGDHARNIAEQIIFVINGTDVRHTSYDLIEQKVQRQF